MKKFILLILLSLMFIPFYVNAETMKAADYIKKIATENGGNDNSIEVINNTDLAYDGTNDNNLRYVGLNPNNYLKFYDAGFILKVKGNITSNVSLLRGGTDYPTLVQDKKSPKKPVKIPINNYVTDVERTYDESSTGTYALSNLITTNKVIIIVSGIVSILVAILLILFNLRKKELTQVEKYKKNINQISKDYSDLIVVVSNEPDITFLKRMYIDKIEDMIDVADQNKVHIILYEAIRNRKTNLYAIVDKYVYIYTITSKDIK